MAAIQKIKKALISQGLSYQRIVQICLMAQVLIQFSNIRLTLKSILSLNSAHPYKGFFNSSSTKSSILGTILITSLIEAKSSKLIWSLLSG